MRRALGEFEQLILLAVLRLGEEAYGMTIRQEVERRTGRDVSAGAVYTTLGRLENRGLVCSWPGETVPERTGQRRRYYQLEPEGAAELYRAYEDVRRMARGLIPQLADLAQRAHVAGDR
ncbi:MAG: helix-turn-helix transcriptional regulator [Gemmatimonadetes bacterium]|nr:helix-turn-helix transcriptional regulator [Gemmatimonadota bacterium]